MKIALIADTHFGARNDNLVLLKHQQKFFDDVFFPYVLANNIKIIVHLGDLVDKRRTISYLTLNSLRKIFTYKIHDNSLDCHIIVGNHDTYYKNTNQINAVNELLGDTPFMHVYDRAETVDFDGLSVFMLPWLCTDNLEESMNKLKDTSAKICFGHLELSGFTMQKGMVCQHGFNKKIFRKFDQVLSGHFHFKSDDRHIYYLGNPTELMWSDYNVKKGFHVFDTITRELDFIENPNAIYKHLKYDDTGAIKLMDVVDRDFETYHDCYVKVIVHNKQNPFFFDRFIETLYDSNPYDVTIVEDTELISEDSTKIENVEDTMTILSSYVSGLHTDLDKHRLDMLLRDLYLEAISIE